MYLTPPVTRRVAVPTGPRVTRYTPLPVRHLCATLLLSSFIGVALWATMRHYPSSSPPVYTVAALADDLAPNHTAWIGRTVWVRGEAVVQLHRPNGVQGVQFMQMYLVDPLRPRDILFMDGSPNPVYATLRSLPLVGHLAPSPQAPHIGLLADYQVQLQLVPCAGGRACAAAVLLDTNLT